MIILIILIIVLLLSLFLINKTLKKKDNVLEDVKLQENTTKNDGFALMLEQEDGTYKESTNSKWPTDMEYNEELSGCMDVNGNKIDNSLSYNDNTNSVKLKVNGVTYCYIYFDQSSGESVIVNVSTDGVKNVLPNYNKFKQELTCKGADASFNTKYQRIEISQVGKKSTMCKLDYSKDTTSYTLLSDKVKNSSTEVSSTNKSGGTDVSYRYIGKTPENYVWFNNELWRIIGLIPVCLESDCGTPDTSLVKIIRNSPIGSLSYSTNESKAVYWGSNMLYTTLNEYYYGKKDGTNSDYCYGYSNSVSNCDYRVIGISSDTIDYYGKMIQKVYWNSGSSGKSTTAPEAYNDETAKQSVAGKIGLLSASDYGYAAGSEFYSKDMNYYNQVTANNCLYKYSGTWTMIVQDRPNVVYINNSGALTNYAARYPGNIISVVYLDANVYIIGGKGTESNPYILGM